MQFTQAQSPVTVSGQALRTSEFQMKMNEKMFEIFSSSIYSNKIRAMVRELCTNAYDIHKTSGIGNTPFEVAVPTEGSPMFVVRDFGTGLSEEQIFKIYTVYFESTKDGDNEAHGGYGLGSKSPLAYVDSFQIRSYQDGSLKCYTCYRKNGTPMISLILETQTDEPNGLEVSVAVNNSDISRFKMEIGYVLSTFPVAPNITNGEVEFFGFKETEKDLYSISNFPRVVDRENQLFIYIEPVLYPLLNDMKQIFKNSKVYEMFFSNSNDRLAFKFPIGSLAIPPSREQIDNTKENIATFQAFMEKMDSIYDGKLEKIYQETKNLPYRQAIVEVKKKLKEITGVADSGLFKFFANNKKFEYQHLLGDFRLVEETYQTGVDPLTSVPIRAVRTLQKPLKKITLRTSVSSILYEELNSRPDFFRLASSYNHSDRINLSYSGDRDRLVPYVEGSQVCKVFILQSKNYKKYLGEMFDRLKDSEGRVFYVLDKTVQETRDLFNKWSIVGDITKLFPKFEIIDWEELKKTHPMSKNKTGVTASPKGSKPHPYLLLDGGALLSNEISINDLATHVDALEDTFAYIRGDDVMANLYINIIRCIKSSTQLHQACAETFKKYEGAFFFTNSKFDVTLEKFKKNDVDMVDVTESIIADIRNDLRGLFNTTANWIYPDSSDGGTEFNNKKFSAWFLYIRDVNLINYISSRYDVLQKRRVGYLRKELREKGESGLAPELESTKDALSRLHRAQRKNDGTNSQLILTREEVRELLDYHMSIEHQLLLNQLCEIGKKIPLVVELLDGYVYNDSSKAKIIFEYLKERGV